MGNTKVVTGEVRFSYCCVWEPRAMEEGGAEKYSVSLIIPKSDKDTVKKIRAAIKAAKEAGKAKLTNPKTGQLYPDSALKGIDLRDGDIDKPEDPAYANSYFVSANSQRKPQIVDRDINPILDKAEFYSGCYGRASINFFAFNVANKGLSKGIGCGLNCLQKLKDGDPLGGGSNAAEDFGGENAWSGGDEDML